MLALATSLLLAGAAGAQPTAHPALDALRAFASDQAPAPPPAATPAVAAAPRTAEEVLYGIRVEGDEAFRARTREALMLLSGVREFPRIQAHLWRIKQYACSGVEPGRRATFYVGRRTWDSSPLWYAGSIAHDAHHVMLYRAGTPWTGKAAETRCIEFQLQVLAQLNAPAYLMDSLGETAKNPTYQEPGANPPLGPISIDDACRTRRW